MLGRVGWSVSFLVPLVVAVAFGCEGGKVDGGSGSGGKGSAGEAGSSGGGPGSGGEGGAGGNPATGGAGGAASGDECPRTSGPGTAVSGFVEGEQTWSLEGSPYRIDAEVIITGDVMVEACVAVLLAPGASIQVRGSLTTRGALEELPEQAVRLLPVVFRAEDDVTPWGQITVTETGFLDLEVTGLVLGGSTGSVIRARGEDQYGLPHRNVRTVGVGIYDSVGVAVEMTSRAGFTEDSVDLFIESAGRPDRPFPISIEAGSLASLPTLLTLENNDHDEIFVDVFRQVHDDTIKNLGYPYHVEGPIYVHHENGVAQTEPSRLVIEPGVTLRMAESAGSGLYIGAGEGYEATLVAEGTTKEPIIFESAEESPAPGDWMGIYFRSPIIDGNSMRFVTVAHAGAESGTNGFGCGPGDNDGSILLLSDGPVEPFIEFCTITDGGGMNQIVLGWPDDPDPSGAANEIFSNNTFGSGPSCQVSLPGADAIPACPDTDACL